VTFETGGLTPVRSAGTGAGAIDRTCALLRHVDACALGRHTYSLPFLLPSLRPLESLLFLPSAVFVRVDEAMPDGARSQLLAWLDHTPAGARVLPPEIVRLGINNVPPQLPP
jgi:hypothetical protein